MFNKKEKTVETPTPRVEIEWTQTNVNGELKEKEYTIFFRRSGYTGDYLYHLSKEDVKKLRDLLNKTCLE